MARLRTSAADAVAQFEAVEANTGRKPVGTPSSPTDVPARPHKKKMPAKKPAADSNAPYVVGKVKVLFEKFYTGKIVKVVKGGVQPKAMEFDVQFSDGSWKVSGKKHTFLLL